MVKKFDEFIKERYDYDDVPIRNHRHSPINNTIEPDGVNKSYIKDDNVKGKELIITNDEYNFQIWKIEGVHSNEFEIVQDGKVAPKDTIYFTVDGEFTLTMPEGIGNVFLSKGNSKKTSYKFATFDTDKGEIKEDGHFDDVKNM